MSQGSRIEWCHDTLNPFIGCQRVSPACDNCYAADFARRFWPKTAAWDGTIERQSAHTIDKAIGTLERAHQPRRIFCGSMTDFGLVAIKDPDGLANFLSQIYRVQEARIRAGRTPHAFIWLTKRPIPLGRFFQALAFDSDSRTFRHFTREPSKSWVRITKPIPGLWVGVTVEDQPRAEQRIPPLLEMEAPDILFVSAEPLLGPLRLEKIKLADGGLQDALRGTRTAKGSDHPISTRRLRWVVTGGETGHRARPSNPDWFKYLRVEVQDGPRGVAFFFKSWGAWGYISMEDAPDFRGQMVAWMSLEAGSIVKTEKPIPGYRMAAKRGSKKNDAHIGEQDKQTPDFLAADATFLLP